MKWKRLAAICLGLLPLSVSAATGSNGKAFNWEEFLGPFHNVVLHYPIGFVTMVCLLEFFGIRRPSDDLNRIIRMTWWLVIASTVLTAALGFARASDGGYGEETLQAHKVSGIAVIVFALIALAVSRFRVRNPERDNGFLKFSYAALLMGTFASMVVAGHKGGDLTHGSDYLTKNAPPVLKQLFKPEKATEQTASVTSTNSPDATVGTSPSFFAQKVWPVFEQKCVRCHGAEKHKGDYRLDTRDHALTAGESEEPPIVPGQPDKSFLVELISMSEDDDEVMPPAGKEQLTAEEKAAIIKWIQDGASYDLTSG